MSVIYGKPVNVGGGGVNETLPAQVTNFRALQVSGAKKVTVSWTNPSSYFSGIVVMKKVGSAPTGVKDGTQVYKGTGTSFTDSDVNYGTTYYYRAFPYNSKGQYQTAYMVANITPASEIELGALTEGTLIKINESNVPTLFYLAKRNYEVDFNRAGRCLMARRYVFENMKWSTDASNQYDVSAVDAFLSVDYINRFSARTRSLIGTTTIKYSPGFHVTSVRQLDRSAFLLSATELGGVFSDLNVEGSELPIASILVKGSDSHGVYSSHWTRSPRQHHTTNVWEANPSGGFSYAAADTVWPIRPSFTLPSTARVSGSPNSDGSYTLIE